MWRFLFTTIFDWLIISGVELLAAEMVVQPAALKISTIHKQVLFLDKLTTYWESTWLLVLLKTFKTL